ncbi:Limb region 1 protein-like [Stylophora pistillata]|uniref:XK-related protein n=2 Tax=Stylophora pistillata TaxID=50429 RepID=A0A2B4S8E1_STYPI|nr:Limb region 1 protein-like [Stylophora pistillata]
MEVNSDGNDDEEQIFYDTVREYVISLLVFIILYGISHATLSTYKRGRDELDSDDEDAFVYRISFWLCTFTLTVSLGAVLLLPMSIFSNEIMIMYPNSYYIKWLNGSLIHGMWNQIFLGSYMSLFVAIPFAYFFTESEGFAGSRKGIMARVYETSVVLGLLAVLVTSIVWVGLALIDRGRTTDGEAWVPGLPFIYSCISLLGALMLLQAWVPGLPFIYSCISLLGALMLLLCTPVGFARMFTVLGQYVVKPQFLRDLDDEMSAIKLEEESIKRKMNGYSNGISMHNGIDHNPKKLKQLEVQRLELERSIRASSLQRNCVYPILLLTLLLLTTSCMAMVALNVLSLLFVHGALPKKSTVIANCIVLLILSSALPVLSRTLAAFARMEAFVFCLKKWRFKDKINMDTYIKADDVLGHIAAAVLFEAVLESAPQFIIQLYAISVQEEPAAIIQMISLPVSFLTLAWAFTTTDEMILAVRDIISNSSDLKVKHKVALYVTHLLLLSSRLFAICYFTVSNKWWIISVLSFHSCVVVIATFILERGRLFTIYKIQHVFFMILFMGIHSLRDDTSTFFVKKEAKAGGVSVIVLLSHFLFVLENCFMILMFHFTYYVNTWYSLPVTVCVCFFGVLGSTMRVCLLRWLSKETAEGSQAANSNDMNSTNVNSSNVNSSNVNSSDVDSSDVNSSDGNSSDVNSSDVNSSNVNSSNVNSSDVNSSNVNSNDVNSSNVNSNDVNSSNVNSSDVDSSDVNSSDVITSVVKCYISSV